MFTVKNISGLLVWEEIKTKSRGPQNTYRAKVHGGWLVETQNSAASSGGLTFVPDPNHEWQLDPV